MLPGKRRRPVAPTQRPPLPKPARSVPKGSVAMVTEVNIMQSLDTFWRVSESSPTPRLGQGRHLEV